MNSYFVVVEMAAACFIILELSDIERHLAIFMYQILYEQNSRLCLSKLFKIRSFIFVHSSEMVAHKQIYVGRQ